MNDQHVNILFVSEVEKHPILYDYNLADHSNKRETDRAWNEIGRHMYMSASECKDRWKNLRAVFVRNFRRSKAAGGAKSSRKAYYLADAMKFAIPYIRALKKVPETQYILPQNEEQQESEQIMKCDDNDSVSLPDICPSPQNTSYSASQLSPPRIPSPPSLELHSTQPAVTFQRRDKLFSKQNRRSSIRLDHHAIINRDSNTEALKMFLLSMVPDLQKMTDEEVRRFKRKTLDAVDDIFLARNSLQIATTPPSSSHPVQEPPSILVENLKSEFPEPNGSSYHSGSE